MCIFAVVCDGFVSSFSAFISFYAIGYTLCFASIGTVPGMFRSEWLKDAKFKSLVANDRTDSMIGA